MSKLAKELRRICKEEGVNFNKFLKKLEEKDRPEPAQTGDMFAELQQ